MEETDSPCFAPCPLTSSQAASQPRPPTPPLLAARNARPGRHARNPGRRHQPLGRAPPGAPHALAAGAAPSSPSGTTASAPAASGRAASASSWSPGPRSSSSPSPGSGASSSAPDSASTTPSLSSRRHAGSASARPSGYEGSPSDPSSASTHPSGASMRSSRFARPLLLTIHSFIRILVSIYSCLPACQMPMLIDNIRRARLKMIKSSYHGIQWLR